MEELKFTPEEVWEYRQKLLEHGMEVPIQNPDRLNEDQMKALLAEVFRQLDKIDQNFGHEPHDTGLRRPKNITEADQNEIFMDFVDWYQIVPTPSIDVLSYVVQKYKPNEYPRVLCVGDGKNCHLGRKLAKRGYDVMSVDPVARPEYSTSGNQTGNGRLKVVRDLFTPNSDRMIDWASVIVGCKVPLCAEAIVGQRKPAVFTISNNVEIYGGVPFRGQRINSSKALEEAIRQCKGVRVMKRTERRSVPANYLFIYEGERQKEQPNPNQNPNPKNGAGEGR